MEALFKKHKLFFLYLLYGLIVFAPFLSGRQRTHDSYLVEIYTGYFYMVARLFEQGRVFSSWFYSILHVLNTPTNLTMALSTFASILFLSSASYIVYRAVSSRVKVKNTLSSVITALGAGMLFFNLFVLEFMIFYENAIMSLGVFFAVLTAVWVICGTRKGYLLAFTFLLISVFAYQPTTAFFPPLALLFTGIEIEHASTKMPMQRFTEKLLLFCKKITPAVLIYTLALFCNVVFLQTFGSGDSRFAGEINLLQNIRHSFFAVLRFFYNQLGTMPPYLFFLFLLVLFLVFFTTALKNKHIFPIFISLLSFSFLFISTLFILLPTASMFWHVALRSGMPMAGIGGLLLLFIALWGLPAQKHLQRITLGIMILFSLFIAQRQIEAQVDHFANRHMDMQELALIGDTIRAYEAYHGITVTHISFGYEEPITWHRANLNRFGDLTLSMWQVEWMPPAFLEDYLGRALLVTVLTHDELKEMIAIRQEHWFTRGRIWFDGDTVYLVLNNVEPTPTHRPDRRLQQ